jgi:hypothetical protein
MNAIYQLENEEKKELFNNIYLEANGGTDMEGEWQFSGSYSISVPANKIGNSFRYSGSVSKPWTKKRKARWKVKLDACGGESDSMRLQVLYKSASSLVQARKMIAESILKFEKSERYKKELLPKILHPDRRIPILKEIKGELVWVATTWVGAWSAIQGIARWASFEHPLGSGQFYYRQPQWEHVYPLLEDGKKDWDNGEKAYKEPRYGSIEVSGYGMSGGGTKGKENKDRIDKAIYDVE